MPAEPIVQILREGLLDQGVFAVDVGDHGANSDLYGDLPAHLPRQEQVAGLVELQVLLSQIVKLRE